MFWVMFFWWGNASAHGGVTIEFDKCVLKIGSYLIHFSGYQPEVSGGTELCEHIPAVGHTIIVMDLVDPELRKLDIDLKIVQTDSWTAAQTYEPGEGGKEVLYYPGKKYERGSITVDHNFSEPGYFVAIVTDNHQKNTSVFPFSVGYGIAAFDANGVSKVSEGYEPYLQSLAFANWIGLCKAVAPANTSRYDAALVAWQKANELALAKAERVWRSLCEQDEQEKQGCAEVEKPWSNEPPTGGAQLEWREATASKRVEMCDDIAGKLEHQAAHGRPLNKEAFDRKYGVEEWPSGKQLAVNPFAYEDKVIAMVLFFGQMMTATEGVFRSHDGDIVFSNMPKGLFTADNANSTGFENIALAGRVLGNKPVKTPAGGEMLVPYLKFIGVQFCYDACSAYGYPQNQK